MAEQRQLHPLPGGCFHSQHAYDFLRTLPRKSAAFTVMISSSVARNRRRLANRALLWTSRARALGRLTWTAGNKERSAQCPYAQDAMWSSSTACSAPRLPRRRCTPRFARGARVNDRVLARESVARARPRLVGKSFDAACASGGFAQ
eukprot:6190439-Pleurochrysis_carterae.AAC.4